MGVLYSKSKTGYWVRHFPKCRPIYLAGICCYTEYTCAFSLTWIEASAVQGQAKTTSFFVISKMYHNSNTTDLHDVGGRPMNVSVAHTAVVTNSGSF